MKFTYQNTYIKKPCEQDWNLMIPNRQGRHCLKCDYQVIDFTRMNEEQFAETLQKAVGKKICGRFEDYQLNQSLRWKVARKNPVYRMKQFALSVGGLILLQLSTSATTASAPKSSLMELPVIQGGETESDTLTIVLRTEEDKRIWGDFKVKIKSGTTSVTLNANNGFLRIPKSIIAENGNFTLKIPSQRNVIKRRISKKIKKVSKQNFVLNLNTCKSILHIDHSYHRKRRRSLIPSKRYWIGCPAFR